jgi:YcxB-like protein
MTVSCQINSAEMREAFRMNLTPSFWAKSALRNARIVIYLVVLIVVLIAGTRGPNPMPAKGVVGLCAAIAFMVALYLWRLHRTLEKSVKTLNESCRTLSIDSQGLTAEGGNGAKSFVPWSAVHRWREGKLVFTLGDAKSFRIVPKNALGEMQSGELRSLLQSQIR